MSFSPVCEKFPARRRLKTKSEFSSVFQQARKKEDRFYTILFKPNQTEHPRLGLVVAKRFFKRAHERNRWKRLVRESFRLHQHLLSGMDIVVLVKKEAGLCSNREFLSVLKKAWLFIQHAGLLSKPSASTNTPLAHS